MRKITNAPTPVLHIYLAAPFAATHVSGMQVGAQGRRRGGIGTPGDPGTTNARIQWIYAPSASVPTSLQPLSAVLLAEQVCMEVPPDRGTEEAGGSWGLVPAMESGAFEEAGPRQRENAELARIALPLLQVGCRVP